MASSRRRVIGYWLGGIAAALWALGLSALVPVVRAPEAASHQASGPTRAGALSERPALYAAFLGARQREGGAGYVLEPAARGWRAHNEAHGFDVGFDGRSVTVRRAQARFTLTLTAVGRGTSASSAPPVEAVDHGGPMLTYRRRGGLSEWYLNGPLGLEQGFTIAEAPAGGGRVRLSLEVGGEVTARMADAGGHVVLATAEGDIYRYGHLVVYDARGNRLAATLSVRGRQIDLEFEDRDARYPIVVDPLVANENASLRASDGPASDHFGGAVAISGDTALVGASHLSEPGYGAAYVFVRDGATWSEQAKLTPSDGVLEDRFGFSVSLSGDTAVVGAVGADGADVHAGAAYVFHRAGQTWEQQAKLVASDGASYDAFGDGVAVDGDQIVVGAPWDDDLGVYAGSAYVFVRSGSSWDEVAKLIASDGGEDDRFGGAVALEGDTLLIGAPYDDDGGTDAGAAYVFVGAGALWDEQTKLRASDAARLADFGEAVALSGETAVVGARYDPEGGHLAGAAYVFVRSGAAWSEQAKLLASDGGANGLFGDAVAISGDSVLIGATDGDGTAPWSGSAYLFSRTGTSWTEYAKLLASDGGESDALGSSVAMDGETMLVGAPDHATGAVYVYYPSELAWRGHGGCSMGGPPGTFSASWLLLVLAWALRRRRCT